ncbi:hypothetical protein PIROE2DRAFT_58531 [Piromyces sp. E2]|nr:hypothetical protein PIROE2DRAFT_58531 [Piromyces sp. E2]|eukprot:OUM67850.1 hypothetical protein PIROE2DRAFT_58531 [Piromyces sp. E2]
MNIEIIKLDKSDAVKVKWGNSIKILEKNESIKFDTSGIGFWNGNYFSMSSGNSKEGNIDISSIDIPITLYTFRCLKCVVHSPEIKIMGETQIENFTAELKKPDKNKISVKGKLTSKIFNLDGILEIKENGTVNIEKDGLLDFSGILNINKDLVTVVRIKNNGYIYSDSDSISCSVNDIINEERGRIIAKEGNFNIEFGGQFNNSGIIVFKKFNIKGRHILNFLQNGLCEIQEEASIDCGLRSTGETYIYHLIFTSPSPSDLQINNEQTVIEKITGKVSILKSNEGAIAEIGEIENGAKYIESSGNDSKLKVGKISSSGRMFVTAKLGGSSMIANGEAKEIFMHSDDGKLMLSNLRGKSTAYIGGNAKLKINGAEDLSLVAKEESNSHIIGTNVKNAIYKNKNNILVGSKIDTIHNHGKIEAADIETDRLINNKDGKIEFWSRTINNKINDDGEVLFRDGVHEVKEYNASNLTIKVRGEDIKLEERDDAIDPRVAILLKDKNANVIIEKLTGYGLIDSDRQNYRQLVPTSFETKGNADVYLNRLPEPGEILIHNGQFTVNAEMNNDFINYSNIDYGDINLNMKMNNNKWENRRATLIAGGLTVNNASTFENNNGTILLEKGLNVKAGNISNIADPIMRENGRWVDDYSNWRKRLVYYCPAKYYSENTEKGIAVVDGDINLKSKNDIRNRFTSLYASGNFKASTEGKFENTVGTIIAEGNGKSEIKAKKGVNNSCLPAYLRKGEAHAKGRCGWGWTRSTWYADSYTAEWITQSHGSTMQFGGDLEIKGHTENFGSTIASGGTVSGDINSRSLFENEAKVEGLSVSIEGQDLSITNARINAFEDRLKSRMKTLKQSQKQINN